MHLEPACLCQRCLSAVARHAAISDDAETVLCRVRAEVCGVQPAKSGDFYLDEHGTIVFTAVYHLKRRYCCGNGCRHCPFTHTVPTA
ncbi:MAG: hypothetical protein HY298_14610 [Verrucomicrobia bacterium]|nr:hypothetical protein [Verrucomicrobiota bacterium]